MLIFLPPVFVLLLLLYAVRLFQSRRSHRPKTALVISLSPADHSPRALAHATCLANYVKTIFLALPPFPNVTSLTHQPLFTPSTPTFLPYKLFLQSVSLIRALLLNASQNVTTILVNSPPALPTIPIVLLARSLFPAATVIIDWHNLGYTLMSPSSPLTPLARFIEQRLTPYAHVHWTVSKAMASFLHHHLKIHPIVVYDTPRTHFIKAARSITPAATHQLFSRLSKLATQIGPSYDPCETPILVTSTSWTPDEDFQILYTALCQLDPTTAPLIVIITGRGPLKHTFEQRFRQVNFKNIAVWTAWLPINDYPLLLASATLGLSLHASSSQLDLPMKVVDMLACNLPVIALRYGCIHELVEDRVNGLLFRDSDALVNILRRLLAVPDEIVQLRQGATKSFADGMDWETYWKRSALPTMPALAS